MKRFYGALLSIFLPILVLGSLTLEREIDLRNGKVLILPITGYDPRDLLSGHFLRFQIDPSYSESVCNEDSNTSSLSGETGVKLQSSEYGSCVCFESREPSSYEAKYLADCSPSEREILKCWTYIKGSCKYGRFEYPFRKYYIPEEKAKEWDAKLREPGAKVQLRMKEDGSGLIETIIWPAESAQ
ncbi:GDYXXLXY protein [Leptospira langatensis]|uniref:GDYXXLXY protein n=1 Tax=Leptospira langatensis TaxID=2484983 RepID=A0A5F1ZXI8_9LEPT|nr:GDYXXLXY domain-containing protein [Leptospira langatensis]TGJ98593.1 GDYXXLXY protein [Leptospira langatensis]TGL43506.1 GDYXXLXY protein [Leptospira langatensis]